MLKLGRKDPDVENCFFFFQVSDSLVHIQSLQERLANRESELEALTESSHQLEEKLTTSVRERSQLEQSVSGESERSSRMKEKVAQLEQLLAEKITALKKLSTAKVFLFLERK